MELEGLVELLETDAEILIGDVVAWKRFTLTFEAPAAGSVITWLPLTLEPGQRVVHSSVRLKPGDDERTVWLEIVPPPRRGPFTVGFATVEVLRQEGGRVRIETFNAFRSQESVRLRRRAASVHVATNVPVASLFSPTHPVNIRHWDRYTATLSLDVRGDQTRGPFRFFTSFGNAPSHESQPAPTPDPPGQDREFVELRRIQSRPRPSLRR